MDVLTVSLSAADAATVATACAGTPHHVVERAPGDLATESGDALLAVFVGADGTPPPLPEALRERTFAVAVTGDDDPRAVLAAVRAGYAVALRRGLDEARVRHLVTYVATQSPPAAARHVVVSDDGMLRAGRNAEPLEPGVAAFLRSLGERPECILAKDDAPADAAALTTAANAALERVGSGGRVLKVPHVGFRFAGTIARA
jgi:hypothetical protein